MGIGFVLKFSHPFLIQRTRLYALKFSLCSGKTMEFTNCESSSLSNCTTKTIVQEVSAGKHMAMLKDGTVSGPLTWEIFTEHFYRRGTLSVADLLVAFL